jgi:hypothetical protein
VEKGVTSFKGDNDHRIPIPFPVRTFYEGKKLGDPFARKREMVLRGKKGDSPPPSLPDELCSYPLGVGFFLGVLAHRIVPFSYPHLLS